MRRKKQTDEQLIVKCEKHKDKYGITYVFKYYCPKCHTQYAASDAFKEIHCECGAVIQPLWEQGDFFRYIGGGD